MASVIKRIVRGIICAVMIVIMLLTGIVVHDCLFDNDLVSEETTVTVETVRWERAE